MIYVSRGQRAPQKNCPQHLILIFCSNHSLDIYGTVWFYSYHLWLISRNLFLDYFIISGFQPLFKPAGKGINTMITHILAFI